MADENKKQSIELREKLNNKLVNSGARFVSVKKVEDGQFQLVVSVDQSFFAEPIQKQEQDEKKKRRKGVVVPLSYETGSLLEKLDQKAKIESLQNKLEIGYLKDCAKNPGKEIARLDQRYRDTLENVYIDNRKQLVEESTAINLYERSEKEYFRTGYYGTAIDLLSNFATTGFYNEINDPNIKEYFDAWVNDSNFLYSVKKIFHSLFKYSVCYILKSSATYEPHSEGISSIPGSPPVKGSKAGLKANVAFMLNELIKKSTGQEMSFDKFDKIYEKELGASTGHPFYYSLLDPKYITTTTCGFYDGVTISISSKGLQSLRDILKTLESDPEKVSKKVKDSIKLLPNAMKEAAKNNKDYVFKDEEISVIYLRKDDCNAYAKPRGSRAFDSFDYKEQLKRADYATVDGIYNYILKVTVGDKDNPNTDDKVLEDLAEAFNTPQKAFAIVWNHTLQIEKITANEVGDILGQNKYEPVENDISAAIGMARAMIDGTSITGDAANLASKATQSEIENARQQVENWIYDEYRLIAKSAGFNIYPVVRWQHTVVSTDGEAVTKASYMQMLDRKAISIQTYMREMGFDYETEKQRMTEELPFITKGVLQAGSPFQKGAGPGQAPTQAPDVGRPKSMPTSPKKPVNEQKVVKRKLKINNPSQQASEDNVKLETDGYITNIVDILSQLSDDTRDKILNSFQQNQSIEEIEEVEDN